MAAGSGAITPPPSSPPPPALSAAPSSFSASPPPRRQTDTTAANYINGLRSKEGKLRTSGPDAFRDPKPASGAACPRDRVSPVPEHAEASRQHLPCPARARRAPSARPCPPDAAGGAHVRATLLLQQTHRSSSARQRK